MEGKMVVLTRGVHQALEEFQWLAEDLSKRPTRLFEHVPLHPTLDGYYDASWYICVEAVLLGPTEVPQTPQPQTSATATFPDTVGAHPIV